MRLAPLHNHSHFSALDGVSTPLDIAQRCCEIGTTAAGITDHGVVSGHLEFDKVMRKFGHKPIFGMEAYHGLIPGKPAAVNKKAVRDQNHFIVLAGTDEGLRNVWRMSDKAAENYHFVGRLTWEMMKDHSEGVYATSSCIQGTIAQGILGKGEIDPYDCLNRYLDIFGDRFFIELHCYPGEEHERLNWELSSLANERGVGVVYATDAHFAFEDQYELHDAYLAMQMRDNVWLDPSERKMWHPKSLYMQDEAQVRRSLAYLPESVVDEALANSVLIADACNARLPEVRRHLPVFVPSECPWISDADKAKSATDLFFSLVERGIEERYGEDAPFHAWSQAIKEAEVFTEVGLEHYFLQAWDVMQFCDSENIQKGAARGSAGASIVSYALGITDIDPLYYNLYFERFFNPGRAKGFPDIDTDIPTVRRADVKEYTAKRFGRDKVMTIGTVTRLKPKTVIDRTAKAFGVSYDEVDALKAIIDDVEDIDILGADDIGWDEEIDPGALVEVKDGVPIFQRKEHYVKEEVGEAINHWIGKQAEDRRDLLHFWISCVAYLCSRVSGYGVHPSGVVISDVDLGAELPGMWNTGEKAKVTQFPMADVDKRQFVKNDYLGLRNLDILEEWCQRVAQKGIDIKWSGIEREDYPEDMWRLLERGFTMGIFQVEDSYSARKLCKDIKPRSIHDLSAIAALNRPGPLRSGAAEEFVARRRGDTGAEADHPILEPILQNTYGLVVYQEQIIQFCIAIGYSEGDADAVRKILGKKDPQEMRAWIAGTGEWAGKGYHAMAERAGIDKDKRETIIEKIRLFALYSFNKCLSGDTVVVRGGAGGKGRQPAEISLRELYAAQESKTPWGYKIRDPKRGIRLLQMDDDGQIRPDRMRRVIHNGVRGVWEVRTEGGLSLKGTPDHLLLSEDGYCRIDQLSIGDGLITRGQKLPAFNQHKTGRGRDHASGSYKGRGFPDGPSNPGWLDGRTQVFDRSKAAAIARAQNQCESCDQVGQGGHSLECAHMKTLEECGGDFLAFHSEQNISVLCNSCHKKLDYLKGERKVRWSKGETTELDRVISVQYVGEEDVYDVEMMSSGHNFVANGIVSHNCHSIGYGTLMLRTLFAKFYSPADFYISCIKVINEQDDPKKVEKTAKLIGEARRMGIEIKPPDIMKSQLDITDDGENIYFGFVNIKGISNTTAKRILWLRDKYGDQISTPEGFKAAMDAEQKTWEESDRKDRSPRSQFNAAKETLLDHAGCFDSYVPRDLTDKELRDLQKELLGVVLTDNSKEIFNRNYHLLEVCDEWSDFLDNDIGKGKLPATITGIRRTKTKAAQKDMAILSLEYQGHAAEVAVFSDKWAAYRPLLKEYTTGIFTLKQNDRGVSLENATVLK